MLKVDYSEFFSSQDALHPRRQILQGMKSKTRPLTWAYYTSGILTKDHLDISNGTFCQGFEHHTQPHIARETVCRE